MCGFSNTRNGYRSNGRTAQRSALSTAVDISASIETFPSLPESSALPTAHFFHFPIFYPRLFLSRLCSTVSTASGCCTSLSMLCGADFLSFSFSLFSLLDTFRAFSYQHIPLIVNEHHPPTFKARKNKFFFLHKGSVVFHRGLVL